MKSAHAYLLIALITACTSGHKSELSPSVLLTGLNGPAYYQLGDNGHPIYVVKKEFFNNPLYFIGIDCDTINLGESFRANIIMRDPNYVVEIDQPVSPALIDSTNNKQSNRVYRFVPDKVGTFEFSGRVKFDTTIVPFSYRFLVKQGGK